ncbi:delayed-early response protein/equilibrative nucleoside transporter [Xaviernesmea oryzae]|uniref:Nickel/cobalt efflux system n=1 Tax=Xaviernesmea oryzae TaxID=464029 RepID=A0A1Q9AZ73_9HYPH|nr:nickel/cobalt transporter [Xaviernesmea oryzae]OLP60993.1 delayed-early response protein/equilibrative nucleoside transporter [Xaviernesmea oryzae]SEL18355.1 High-affinity nickel-transport protein [Xaviernesmea oryzae]
MLKRPRLVGLALGGGLALLALHPALALAQSPLGIGTAEPSITVGGPLAGLFAWVNHEQQLFYRTLTDALRAMRNDPWQLWSLVGLSFLYGVFHAAGPGHGKAVISSYMLANEIELKRGVALAFLSAFLQGVMAIVLIGMAYYVLRGSGISLTRATTTLETASYALVAAFGAWLLFRKLRSAGLFRRRAHAAQHGADAVLFAAGPAPAAAASTSLSQANFSGAATARDSGDLAFGHAVAWPQQKRGGLNYHGTQLSHRTGDFCEACGTTHLPDPARLGGERLGASEAWSAVLAVGLRPCSGALIVLSFALLNNLMLGGVFSVLAMSVGTAITVSLLATIAVTAKGLALRLASSSGAASRIGTAIEILGALFVLLLGLLLLGAALTA